MRPNAAVITVLLAALAAGCASPQGKKTTWPWPEEPRVPAPSPPPLPEDETPGVPSPIPPTPPAPGSDRVGQHPKTAAEISNAAVLSLMGQAREHRSAGRPDQAAAALERAVRIEPRNYFVWAMLAQTHLDQGNFDQAETVAQRSNALARGNLYVEVENWKTISSARAKRGDATGASQAQARVDEIQRTLGGG